MTDPSMDGPAVAVGRAWSGVLPGASAGLVGGLVFGAVMTQVGFLPTVAAIVRVESAVVGFVVHMVIAAIIGAGFGLLVVRQRTEARELLFWGLIYGALWWCLGPLTLLPILLGRPVTWGMATGQALLPSLIAHLVYGAVTAATYTLILRARSPHAEPVRPGSVLCGLAAGVGVAVLLVLGLQVMAGESAYGLLLAGVVVGAAYPLLFGDHPEGTGPALIRGMAYGFACWILVVLTILPLMLSATLDWSLPAVRLAVPLLPAYVLLGAGTGAAFTWLTGFIRALSTDDIRKTRQARLDPGRLNVIGYGVAAGLVGGLIFTLIMIPVDALPRIARLTGADTALPGLLVHLVIAQIIGVSYAICFRRRSFDLASGIGWGVSYGVLWWFLGALTLLPLLLGGTPRWAAADLAAAFPSLVGHVAYGAALGAVFQRLEQRISPWWLTRGRLAADRAVALRDQTLGSAPAMWTLVLFIALAIPTLLSA